MAAGGILIRRFLLVFSFIGIAEAAEWESSLATVPALRTAGASLVSSDAVVMEGESYALVTYWESRAGDDVDFYRCVDITDSSFATVRQDCWKALRPTGRAAATISQATSSAQICGRPNTPTDTERVAFCAFSEPLVLSTPHFEITLSPFERGGLVALREQGRHLIVVDENLPASVLLEVRAEDLAARPDLTGVTSTPAFARQPPEGLQCALENLAGTQWAACHPDGFPTSVVQFLFEADTVYQVTFSTEVPAADRAVIRGMLQSLRVRQP